MLTEFQKQFGFGRVAESKIAIWLRKKGGNTVIPVYDIEMDTGKGPQIFAPNEAFIAPDLLTFTKKDGFVFVEAKRKSVFTWYRRFECWTTGIDLRHYEDYKRVFEHFGRPVWIMFLHESIVTSLNDQRLGCPCKCPVGLFGGSIKDLMRKESHRSPNHGTSGMVYWEHGSLKLLATLEEINNCECVGIAKACS
jgi:hypothetical protein